MNTLQQKIKYTLELVKFSHTLFALPFALSAYFLATQGRLHLAKLLWVLLCLVSARTAAMAFNRLADLRIDTKNPRTQGRHLPQGLLSRAYVMGITLLFSMLFLLGAHQLNTLAFALAPLCLGLLFLYSLTKRFTHFTQFFLGLALGMAPVAATIAVQGIITWPSALLGLAVLFWVAGFDLLYSLQDLEFDRNEGLHSLAVKWGPEKSLRMARLFHLIFFLFLIGFGQSAQLGLIYFGGLLVAGGFLCYQHWTIRRGLTHIQTAFFTANGLLSLFFFAFTLGDLLQK